MTPSTRETPYAREARAVRRRLAAAVPPEHLGAACDAYEAASIAGLCHEGAWEVALGAARPETPAPLDSLSPDP